MKIPKLAFAMGCIDDDLMVAAEEYKPIPQANVIFHWKRFAAIAACLCVLIAGAVLMSVPEDSGTPVLLWGADFQAVDYLSIIWVTMAHIHPKLLPKVNFRTQCRKAFPMKE